MVRTSVTDKLNRGTRHSVSHSRELRYLHSGNRFRVHPSLKTQFRKIRVDLLERTT